MIRTLEYRIPVLCDKNNVLPYFIRRNPGLKLDSARNMIILFSKANFNEFNIDNYTQEEISSFSHNFASVCLPVHLKISFSNSQISIINKIKNDNLFNTLDVLEGRWYQMYQIDNLDGNLRQNYQQDCLNGLFIYEEKFESRNLIMNVIIKLIGLFSIIINKIMNNSTKIYT